ncbi:MAG: hypothetical protein RLP44_22605 [Aggregatilineales bacterium]
MTQQQLTTTRIDDNATLIDTGWMPAVAPGSMPISPAIGIICCMSTRKPGANGRSSVSPRLRSPPICPPSADVIRHCCNPLPSVTVCMSA